MRGDISKVRPLDIETVSRIHFRGGSTLGTARANPTKEPGTARGDGQLAETAGSDTAHHDRRRRHGFLGHAHFRAFARRAQGGARSEDDRQRFGSAGVDPDLRLSDRATRRHRHRQRSVGRRADHLALVLRGRHGPKGGSLGARHRQSRGRDAHLDPRGIQLEASTAQRNGRYLGRRHHQAPGLRPSRTAWPCWPKDSSKRLDLEELAQYADVERDEHDHIRIAEIDFGRIIKARVSERLKEFGIKVTIVSKDIGYELRCTDPIPFDMEYTRDLGYCAAKYLLDGGSGAMVTIQQGKFKPIMFADMLDPRNRAHPRTHGGYRHRVLQDRSPLHAPPAQRRLRGPG